MKLKNLFTCTVTGLLLCTSCIKDEAPNAEADILNCILPAEMLTGTDIDYNRPYDKSLNAYPIYIEVNNGTDLTRLAPTFELTEGASIEPANGSTQNFTNPVRYTVTSEDKNWHRTYAINIHYPETKSIPTVFNFENVKTVPYNKNEYYVLYEAASGYSTLTWSSGNQGFALTGSGYTPNDFPTSISPNGRTGNCLQLITRKTGSLGTLVGMPIAAGNLFIGSFDIGSAMSDALSATKFGTTFYYEPIKLVGYYKYKAGPEFYENGESTNRKDVFNIYALFYEKTKDVQMLDGHIAKNNYEHENMVAAAVITDTHETSEWTRFELDFNYEHYGKTIDPQKLANGGYNVSIVLSASKDGDVFQGAPGSTLLIDDLKLVCKQPLRYMNIFRGLHNEGRTILLVTHEPDIATYASRNVVLKDGIIVEDSINSNMTPIKEVPNV